MLKNISLTPLEQEIMSVVWNNPDCDVRTVCNKLSESKEIAYTSVMTMMNRLVEKGILSRTKRGNKFLYEPLTSRKEAAKGVFHKFFSTVFDNYGQDGVIAFAEEVEHLSKEKKEQLMRMLQDET